MFEKTEMEIMEYIDVPAALIRIRGNKIIFKKMLGLFMQSAEFSSLEESLSAGDLQKASEFAHGIKGMTGNLEMKPLFELSAELMIQFKNGERNEAAIAKYRNALEETRACIEPLRAMLDAGKF